MESQVISAAAKSLETGEPQRLFYEFRDPDEGDVGVCGGEMEVFVEPILPDSRLIILGAGHVGQAIAYLGKWLGFTVVVVDDRPGFATLEQVPYADAHYTTKLGDLKEFLDITANDYLVLTTRGVPLDIESLPGVIISDAAYIGVIGSKRRWETTVEGLLEKGITAEVLERVRSPIGLEIHAESPEEIAVSVLAEIIMAKRGGSGEPMAHQPKVANKQEN
jgi:xanthine dehydrogenase accessory factor